VGECICHHRVWLMPAAGHTGSAPARLSLQPR
jgi:hypothetical protein